VLVKVFISWSGDRSRAVAEVLSDWIKCVLQASEPWISTKHIDRGALWFTEINEKLRDISVGIVCLTHDNKDKPWILFESGALAKGLSGNRVCTFLVDLEPHDLTDPLAQFNHTKPNKESVWELIRTLNACLAERSLGERVLEKAFAVYWPQFETEFALALAENEPEKISKPRPQQDVMMEILSATREMSKRISILETQQPAIMPTSDLMKWKNYLSTVPEMKSDSARRWADLALTPAQIVEITKKLKSEVSDNHQDQDNNQDKD